MFWLVGSWKSCLVGWFLERVCYYYYFSSLDSWLVAKGMVGCCWKSCLVGWFLERVCYYYYFSSLDSWLVAKGMVGCCWSWWGDTAVVGGERLIGKLVGKWGDWLVSKGGWWLVVIGVGEVQDRLLEEVCFFFGWLNGWLSVGWLREVVGCCWGRWGGAAVVVGQRLIGYFVAKWGDWMIVHLSIGCLVGCGWRRLGGAAVVAGRRLIGYFVANRGDWMIVLLSIGCLVGCCWLLLRRFSSSCWSKLPRRDNLCK